MNLTAVGILCLVVGLYFLFVAPGDTAVLGHDVVNIQRLTIGETFTIIGAIFLAAAWRPL
jgi:hypothetical protein